MAAEISIRLATQDDSSAWAELFTASCASKRQETTVEKLSRRAFAATTLIAENEGELQAGLTLSLASEDVPETGHSKAESSVSAGLGVLTFLLVSSDGENDLLEIVLRRAIETFEKQGGQLLLAWVSPEDNRWIKAMKESGFACVGFDPTRTNPTQPPGAFCFCHLRKSVFVVQASNMRSLPDISAVISLALKGLQLKPGPSVQDGSTHYPLTSDAFISQNTVEEYESGRQLPDGDETSTEAIELLAAERKILHLNASPPQILTAQRNGAITAGLKYVRQTPDRAEVIGAYCNDGLSLGVLLERLLNLSRGRMYSTVEMTVPLTAIELLATAEALGFVATAFFPSVAAFNHHQTDAIVLVRHLTIMDLKPPLSNGLEAEFAATVLRTISRQRDSEAIVRLLGDLEVFRGLGPEELRRLADLGKQELYQKGKPVFRKGDDGDKAYVVLRGRVEVKMEDQELALVSFESGRMIGDFALLDGRPRSADAVAEENSILLEIDRRDFRDLIQREPAMGVTIMENLALHIVDRFRRMTKAVEDAGIDLQY